MPTLTDLARHVKIEAEYGGVDPSPDFTPGHHPYKITLTYQQRTLTTPFYMGPALKHEPTAVEVLGALLSDADIYEGSSGFEDWAEGLGFDTNSRKAEHTYKAVEQQTAKLKHLLGDDYETFLSADHD